MRLIFYYIFLAAFILTISWFGAVITLGGGDENTVAAFIIFLPLAIISGLITLFLRLSLRSHGIAVKGKITSLVIVGALLFGIIWLALDIFKTPIYQWLGIPL